MFTIKTFAEINEKIKQGTAVVLTAEEVATMAEEQGVKEVARKVDVVTTGTFGPMCSSGLFMNFGHSTPAIKMSRVWLNDVPAYAGVAAVDAYLGATEIAVDGDGYYGGAHVIEELVSGKSVRLYAEGKGTDCYPRKEIATYISCDDINECTLFNPRNAYQNYAAAINGSKRTCYTYMGMLLPNYGNITYSTSGLLSPLHNDPYLRTIGIGSRIFFCGATGYVAWQGTQHNPMRPRSENGIPIGPAATLSLIGDLKQMSSNYLRAAVYKNYGVSMFVGVGIPIPILDEDMARFVSVKDKDITTTLFDYGAENGRPAVRNVNYEELRSGEVEVNGRKVRTAPLSSFSKAREIADTLRHWILDKKFFLQEPVAALPANTLPKPLAVKEGK